MSKLDLSVGGFSSIMVFSRFFTFFTSCSDVWYFPPILIFLGVVGSFKLFQLLLDSMWLLYLPSSWSLFTEGSLILFVASSGVCFSSLLFLRMLSRLSGSGFFPDFFVIVWIDVLLCLVVLCLPFSFQNFNLIYFLCFVSFIL